MPLENALEASIVPNIDIIPVKNLQELIAFLNGEEEMPIQEPLDFSKMKTSGDTFNKKNDFMYVLGQEHAKRALEI
jgi:magnesium chelatase family protein